MRSTSAPSNPASSSRSEAWSRTSPWAQGQALIPVASTPTTRREPAADAAAIPISETISCVRMRVTGVSRSSGYLAVTSTSARSACWRPTTARAMCSASSSTRSASSITSSSTASSKSSGKRDMCTPRWSGSRSTEQEISAKTSFSCGPRRSRIALLTPRTPARERPMRTSGSEAWRSERRSVRSIYAPDRTRGNSVTDETTFSEARQPGVPRPAHAARDRLRVRADDHPGGRARPDAGRLLGDDRAGLAAAGRAAGRALARRADRGRPLRPEAWTPCRHGELAAAAAESLGAERVGVSGDGVGVGRTATRRNGRSRRSSSAPFATAVSIGSSVVADGTELRVSPITPASAPVVLGEDLRDLGAAVAVRHVEWLGGSVSVDGETLTIRL